jgi:hypothetical protein
LFLGCNWDEFSIGDRRGTYTLGFRVNRNLNHLYDLGHRSRGRGKGHRGEGTDGILLNLFSKCEKVRHLSSTGRIFLVYHTLQVVVGSRLLHGYGGTVTPTD